MNKQCVNSHGYMLLFWFLNAELKTRTCEVCLTISFFKEICLFQTFIIHPFHLVLNARPV